TGNAVVSAQCNEMAVAALALTEANLNAHAMSAEGYDTLTNPITDSLDGADLFSNLAVLSALCDPTRVVVLKYPATYNFRGLGMMMDSHSMANRTGNASLGGTCVNNVNDMIMTIDRYYAAKFAHLVSQLDAIEE